MKKLLILTILFFSISARTKDFEPVIQTNPVGTHILLELWGADIPDSKAAIEDIIIEGIYASKSTLIKIESHKFEPQGITAFALLAESHISVHTWPEFGYVAIDVFTCGTDARPEAAVRHFINSFNPKKHKIHTVVRGTEEKMTFGKEVIIDLFECDPWAIRSKRSIARFAKELCALIKVKPFAEPFIERFALDKPKLAGYSLGQMIETSLISAHFSEGLNSAYINIFSCAPFNEEVAVHFAHKFFGAKSWKFRVILR